MPAPLKVSLLFVSAACGKLDRGFCLFYGFFRLKKLIVTEFRKIDWFGRKTILSDRMREKSTRSGGKTIFFDRFREKLTRSGGKMIFL